MNFGQVAIDHARFVIFLGRHFVQQLSNREWNNSKVMLISWLGASSSYSLLSRSFYNVIPFVYLYCICCASIWQSIVYVVNCHRLYFCCGLNDREL